MVDVLKGEDLLRSTNLLDANTLIDAIMLEATAPGNLYLIMGIEPPEFIWSNPIAINKRAVTYLKKLEQLPESGPDRLAFFQQYLEDKDDVLARDALMNLQSHHTTMCAALKIEWIRLHCSAG